MDMPVFQDLTVLRAQVYNIRRVRFVDITPTDTVTKISGKNMQGKSSFLQAIEWLFGGKVKIKSLEPIHRGQQIGRVYVELGKAGGPVELQVTLTLRKKDDGEFVHSLTVEAPNGASWSAGQTLLDSLRGDLTFDPSSFLKMEPKQKFEALRQFVDYDFDEHKRLQDEDYEQRRQINQKKDGARKAAALIEVPDDTPDEPIDVSALVQQLKEAGEFNTQLVRRANNRQNKRNEADQLVKQAQQNRERAAELRAQADALDRAADEALEQAKAIDKLIADAPPLPERIDVEAIQQKIDNANEINKAVANKQRKQQLIQEADEHERQSDELTARMAERENAKRAAVAKAHLPVDGLGFADDHITLNGFPLEEASTAELCDACTAIAMALNPTLKIILIRNGNDLDQDMRARIAQRAAEKGYRVFMECVDDGSSERITIENGIVKGTEIPEPDAIQPPLPKTRARAKRSQEAQP